MEIQRRRVRRNSVSSFPLTFDGGLQSCVRAELITELLKYFMYERQQIPLPFDVVKREIKQDTQLTEANNKQKPGRSMLVRLEKKKALDTVKKLEETILKVKHAFEVCPEIKQAAIVLGATAVSPKEVFVIELPPLNPDADNLCGKMCMKSLFRQLIMQDPLGRLKEIYPTNICVLLYAPRDSCLSWFNPKPNYKLPLRGKQFHFNFQSTCGQGKHDISKDFSIIDLSGFESLESFVEDVSMTSDCTHTENMSTCSEESTASSDYVCITSDDDLVMINNSDKSQDVTPTNCSYLEISSDSDKHSFTKTKSASAILAQSSAIAGVSETYDTRSQNESKETMDSDSTASDRVFSLTDKEYIWFQSPVVIKGYRNKSTKKA